MSATGPTDAAFVGTVPDVYERLLVPMIFAEAAAGLAAEIARLAPDDILETAAGTGVLTRALARRCPGARIVATDLNEPMLAVGRRATSASLEDVADRAEVRWQPADAQRLELDDDSFDVVACQFGVMFFPDRPSAYREARRVLRGGGSLVLSVWDSLETNDFARVATEALGRAVPGPIADFMARTPHGHHDEQQLCAELGAAGFTSIDVTPVEATSRATAVEAATAYCQGTPLRAMLADHGSPGPDEATELVAEALQGAFGQGVVEGRIRSLRVIAG